MYEPSKQELDDLEMAFSSASKSELKRLLYYIEALYGDSDMEEVEFLTEYLKKKIAIADDEDQDMWNYSAGENE